MLERPGLWSSRARATLILVTLKAPWHLLASQSMVFLAKILSLSNYATAFFGQPRFTGFDAIIHWHCSTLVRPPTLPLKLTTPGFLLVQNPLLPKSKLL